MKNAFKLLYAATLSVAFGFVHASFAAPAAAPHSFGVANGKFVLDGEPFQIIAGSMHYVRARVLTGGRACAWPKPWG